MPTTVPTWVALLRGINVGGKTTIGTGRNWRTVRKLFELAQA